MWSWVFKTTSDSEKGHLSKSDWQSVVRNTFMFVILPQVVLYLTEYQQGLGEDSIQSIVIAGAIGIALKLFSKWRADVESAEALREKEEEARRIEEERRKKSESTGHG